MGFVAYLDRLDNPNPWGIHVVSNPSYVYPASGYVDAELYAIQADSSKDPDSVVIFTAAREQDRFKYIPRDTPGKDTLPTDLNIVMTDLRILPPYPDSITVYNWLGVVGDTSRDANKSCDSLAKAYNQVRDTLKIGKFGDDTTLARLLNCKLSSCTDLAGDANGSGGYTLSDVIAIVNYIFNKPGWPACPSNNKDCWFSKAGLAPVLCRGDWNGSGNTTLSDVIQAVNKIFNKPGTWTAKCVGVCCLPVCIPL